MIFHLRKFRAYSVLSFILLAACSHGHKGTHSENNDIRGDKSHEDEALTHEAAITRAKQIAHVSYTLWFRLDDTGDSYEGRAVLNFDLRESAHSFSSEVPIDFEEGVVKSISLNNAQVPEPETHYDGHHIIFNTSELTTGSNRVEIAFEHKYSHTGEGLHQYKDPEDENIYLYSDFEPYYAHRMFPCFDQPDLKASFELTVDAPKEWQIISNTAEHDVTKLEGRKSWAFPPSPLISTYIFALHAGPYKMWKADADGIPLRLFARQTVAKWVDYQEWFRVTRAGIKFYNEQFGYPLPYAKYDQVLVPEYNMGAMENAAAVIYSERYIHRGKVTKEMARNRADTILHEMAHMWFGDLVTMRWWNGLWLNESFATFMSFWALQGTGDKDAWQDFFANIKEWAYWQDQLITTHPIESHIADTDHAASNFDGITYGKGASAIKQLFYYLGKDDFREGLQRYFEKYALRNASINNFMQMLAEASSKNLTEWQHVWLQRAGVNSLEAVWSCDEDGEIAKMTLKQGSEDGAPLRPHRTRVALYSQAKGGSKYKASKILDVTYSQAETSVDEAVGKPCPAFVFPNYEDYDFAKVTLDPKSLEAVETHLSQVEDPLTRQMLWYVLWDMTTDGRIAANQFADIVIRHAGKEKEPLIVKNLSDSLTRNYFVRHTNPSEETLLRFLAPTQRQEYQGKIEDFLNRQAVTAAPGSDLQLIWFQTYLRAAATPKATNFISGLLKGKRHLSGLKIDQERRWDLISALARLGESESPTLISDELKKDPSDMGVNASITAEASMPDLAVKKKWMQKMTREETPLDKSNDKPLPLSKLKQAMQSFHLLNQEELGKNFVEAYFDAIPRLVDKEESEFVATFAQQMYPALCTQEIVERTTKFLDSHSKLPPAVEKSLKVHRQEEERCVRARALGTPPQIPTPTPTAAEKST